MNDNQLLTSYPELARLQYAFDQAEQQAAILLLGDSIMQTLAHQDRDRRTLPQLIEATQASTYQYTWVAQPAYHLSVYYHLIAALSHMRHRPLLVIVPINLRSFSPQWDWNPRWQFESELGILRGTINQSHPLTIPAPSRDTMTDRLRRFEATPIHYPLSTYTTIGQFEHMARSRLWRLFAPARRYRQLFIYHYTYPFGAGHRHLAALDRLLSLAQAMQIRVLLYITPINIQAGRHFVGQHFLHSVEENLAVLIQAIRPWLSAPHLCFRNWFSVCGANRFLHPASPTEHLNEHGRRQLADLIGQTMNGLIHEGQPEPAFVQPSVTSRTPEEGASDARLV